MDHTDGFKPINQNYTLAQFISEHNLNDDCASTTRGLWGTSVTPVNKLSKPQQYVELYAMGQQQKELKPEQQERALMIILDLGDVFAKIFNDPQIFCTSFHQSIAAIINNPYIKNHLINNPTQDGRLDSLWNGIMTLENLFFETHEIYNGKEQPFIHPTRLGNNQALEERLNKAIEAKDYWELQHDQLIVNMYAEANTILDETLARYEEELRKALASNSNAAITTVYEAVQEKRRNIRPSEERVIEKKAQLQNKREDEVRHDKKDLKKSLDDTLVLLNQARNVVKIQKDHHDQLINSLKTKYEAIISDGNIRLTSLENSLKNQDGVIQNLENELNLSNQKVNEKTKEILENQQQIKTLKNKLADQEKQHTVKVNQLNSQIQQLQSVNNPEAEQELAKVKKQLADLEQTHKSEVKGIREELEDVQKVNQSLAKSAEESDVIKQIQQQDISEKDENIKKLKEQIDSLKRRPPVTLHKDQEGMYTQIMKLLEETHNEDLLRLEERLQKAHTEQAVAISVAQDNLLRQLELMSYRLNQQLLNQPENKELQQLNSEVGNLTKMLNGERASKETIESQAQGLQNAYKQLEKLLGERNSEIKELKETLRLYTESGSNAYKKNIEAIQKNYHGLEEQWQTALKAKDESLQGLEKNLKEALEQYSVLQNNASKLENEKNSAKRLAQEGKEKAENLEQTVTLLQKNIENLEQLQKQTGEDNFKGQQLLEKEINDVQTKLSDSQSNLEEQLEVNEGQKERIASLQEQQKLNQAQQKELKEQLQQQTQLAQTLQNELNLKASDIEKLKLENGVLKQNESDVEKLQHNLTKAQKEVEDKSSEAQKLAAQIKELEIQIGNLGNQAEKNENLTTELNQLQSTLENEQIDLGKQKRLVSSLEKQQLDLEEKIELLNKKLTSGKEVQENLKTKHNKLTDEHQVLQKNLETTQDLLKLANTHIEEKNGAVNELQTEVKQLKEAAELGDKKNVKLNAQLETLKKQLEEKQTAFEEDKKNILGLVNQLTEKMLNLQTVLKSSEQEKKELQNEIDGLKNEQFLGLDGETEESSQSNSALETKIENLEKELQLRNESIETLSDQLKTEKEEVKSFSTKATQHIDELNSQIEKLQEQLIDANRKIKQIEVSKKFGSKGNEGVQPLVDNTGLSDQIGDLQKKLANAKKEASQAKEGAEKLVEEAQTKEFEERELRQKTERSLVSVKLKFNEQEVLIAKQAATFEEFEKRSSAKQEELQQKFDKAQKLAENEKAAADLLRQANEAKDKQITELLALLQAKNKSE